MSQRRPTPPETWPKRVAGRLQIIPRRLVCPTAPMGYPILGAMGRWGTPFLVDFKTNLDGPLDAILDRGGFLVDFPPYLGNPNRPTSNKKRYLHTFYRGRLFLMDFWQNIAPNFDSLDIPKTCFFITYQDFSRIEVSAP